MNEDYVPPPKKFKSFEGVGQKLGRYVKYSIVLTNINNYL